MKKLAMSSTATASQPHQVTHKNEQKHKKGLKKSNELNKTLIIKKQDYTL